MNKYLIIFILLYSCKEEIDSPITIEVYTEEFNTCTQLIVEAHSPNGIYQIREIGQASINSNIYNWSQLYSYPDHTITTQSLYNCYDYNDTIQYIDMQWIVTDYDSNELVYDFFTDQWVGGL